MQLLDEARADGVEIPPLTLYAPNDRYVLDKEMGEAIAGYWRAIGLEVEYIPESRTTLFPRHQALESTDPTMVGFGNTQMRADYPFNLWIQKRDDPPSRGSYYARGPDEWDAMIDELVSLPSGAPETIELARELDDQVVEYAPWVFVLNYIDLFGVSEEVDWQPYPFESRYLWDAQAKQ
jgi:ABC-type transport system substrate-binding protein